MKFSRLMVVLFTLIGLACDLDGSDAQRRAGDDDGVRRKRVVVHSLERVKGDVFNFNADVPDMLAGSDGVLYVATTGKNDLFAWKVAKGNQQDAWVKLTDFVGAHGTANFDLSGGTRAIQRLAPVKGGVAVAVSDDTTAGLAAGTPGAQLGMVVFLGQAPEAATSVSLHFDGNQGFSVMDLKEVASAIGEPVVMALIQRVAGGNLESFVVWSNRHRLVMGAEGIHRPLAGPEMAVRFPGPPVVALPIVNNGLHMLASLPDKRVVLAKANGLLTMAKDGVGKPTADNPLLEQRLPADVLDATHKDQWKAAVGRAPTQIGAMALVGGKYLVMGFVDNGTGNGGMAAADVTGPSFRFTSNFKEPKAKVKKIVDDNGDARLIAEDGVYAFKDGLFTQIFNGATMEKDRAYVSTGVEGNPQNSRTDPLTFDNFVGGNAGEVLPDGTKFFDASPGVDEWFYATDKGLFSVKTTTVTKSFEKE